MAWKSCSAQELENFELEAARLGFFLGISSFASVELQAAGPGDHGPLRAHSTAAHHSSATWGPRRSRRRIQPAVTASQWAPDGWACDPSRPARRTSEHASAPRPHRAASLSLAEPIARDRPFPSGRTGSPISARLVLQRDGTRREESGI